MITSQKTLAIENQGDIGFANALPFANANKKGRRTPSIENPTARVLIVATVRVLQSRSFRS